MKIELSKAYNKYGASMGRRSYSVNGKCHLQKIPLDSGGCDRGGAYWGLLGEPLYCAQDSEGNRFFTRAKTREEAKEKIRNCRIPQNREVTFYR